MNSYFTATREEADRENQNPHAADIRNCFECSLWHGVSPGVNEAACPGYFNTLPLDILFIGMSPGAEEDVAGRPFIGRAGKLLFHLYQQVFDTDAWGVTNMVRCHTPENRPPKIMEIAACDRWLRAELKAAAPKVIYLLGNSAIPLAFGKAKIGQVHGKARVTADLFSGDGYVSIACYHPAAALRDNSKVPLILEAFKLGNELLLYEKV